MMQKIILSLLFVSLSAVVQADTISDFKDRDMLGHSEYLWFQNKLDIAAAQAVCQRMLNIADTRNVKIVINEYERENYNPTVQDCNTLNIDFAMFIALEAAKQLNMTPESHTCKHHVMMDLSEQELQKYYTNKRDYTLKGSPDIYCSAKDDYCVVNQIAYDKAYKRDWVFVFCIKTKNLKCHTSSDGLNVLDSGSGSIQYTGFGTAVRTDDDFDKSCKYRWIYD